MSPLTVALWLTASACTGAPEEVPVSLSGWSEADAVWLREELTRWLSDRDRVLCDGPAGLSLDAAPLEAVVHFGALERTLPRSGAPAELFRYQVAVAGEELARATWEMPPPPPWSLFARGEASWVSGFWSVGGGLGASRLLLPSFRVELAVTGSALSPHALDAATTVRGAWVAGSVTASWLPVALGVMRLGLRASVRGGATLLSVGEASSTLPFFGLGGGLTAGVETRRLSVLLFGEAGDTVLAPLVQREGVTVFTLRGFTVVSGLQVGVRW